MPFVNSQMLGVIGGFRPVNVFSLLILILWILKGGEILSYTSVVRFRASMLYLLFVVIFSVAFFRTFENFDVLYMRRPHAYPTSSLQFIWSHWLKHLLISSIFLYMINHIKSSKEAEKVVDVLLLSFLVVGIFAVLNSMDVVLSGGSRKLIKENFSVVFGLHYNTVGTILMISLPIALNRAMGRGKAWSLVFIILFLGLLLTQSRGAIGGGVFGIFIYLYFIRRVGFETIIALLLIGGVVALLGDQLILLFSRGLESGDVSQITSGRLDNMWIPMIIELIDRPDKLIFGYGLYGMVLSDSYIYVPNFYQSGHVHNAYLDLIIDSGLIAFIPVFLLSLSKFRKAVRFSRRYNNVTCLSLISSVTAYLVAAIVGAKFFPHEELMMLIPVIALIVVIHIHANDTESSIDKRGNK